MLTRQENIGTPQQYYLDSLLPKVGVARSVFDNFAAGVATPVVGMRDLDSTFAREPEGKAIHDTLNSVQLESQNPNIGWGQASADYLANIIGYGINPLSWGFGRLGGLAAEGISTAAEKAAPTAANVFMRKPLSSLFSEPLSSWIPSEVGEGKTLSSALLSKNALDAFGIGVGVSVPGAIEANFNQDSGHVNWGGAARDAGEMGALGLALGSVSYAFGMLKGKVNRGIGEPPGSPITQADLDNALEKGDITKDEHQWYSDYTALQSKEKPSDPAAMDDLTKRATDIVNNNGQDANVATHEVPFNILEPKDMDNLQAVVPDQLVSGLPDNVNKALSDYIVHNRLDALRENPQTLDGVRGFVDTMNEKLANKGAKQAESDKILDEYLTKGAKENLPFSQKELFKHMRQAGFEASHIKQLPVTIPENIGRHLKAMNDIDELNKQNKDLLRKNEKSRNPKYTDAIKDNEKRIKVLSRNIYDYTSKMNRTKSAFSEVKDLEERIQKYKSQNEIYRQKDKLITSGKRYLDKIANNEAKIAKIKESLPKILTPKEELENIRKTLITDKGLPKNWERSNDYHRLLDLAHVWHNARTLLDRVNMERDYQAQEAYRNVADTIIKIADSDLPRLAKPDNVTNYLKARIEGNILKKEPIEFAEEKARAATEIPKDADEVLNQQEAEVKNSKAQGLSQEFRDASDKYREFKESEGIFKNLISCVMGSLNG